MAINITGITHYGSLSHHEEVFCRDYVKTGDIVKAIISSNINDGEITAKNALDLGRELLKKKIVKDRVEQLMRERGAIGKLSKGYVVEKLMTTLEHAQSEGDHKTVIKAAETLGRHLKMFTDKHEIEHNFSAMGDVEIDGNKLTFNIGERPKQQIRDITHESIEID